MVAEKALVSLHPLLERIVPFPTKHLELYIHIYAGFRFLKVCYKLPSRCTVMAKILQFYVVKFF